MYGKVKLSKRQIKEDKFTSFMLNAKHQFLENWQFYIIGVVIVVLMIFGAVYYINMLQTQKDEAAGAYSNGVNEYRQQNYQLAITSLDAVTKDYSGTKPAIQATYLIGKINLEQRNYPEAIRHFELYIQADKTNEINLAAAFAGIATAYSNQGQFAEAASKFAEAISVDINGPLISDYHMSAMRNYLAAGDKVSAEIHLEKIKELFADTDFSKRAVKLFAEGNTK